MIAPFPVTAHAHAPSPDVEQEPEGSLTTALALEPHERAERGSELRIAAAVRTILDELGLDRRDPHLAETDRRVARAYLDLFRGVRADAPPRLTTFPNVERSSSLIVLRRLSFSSMCAHHLLPFLGHVHIGYVPGDRLLGLSKFYRALEHCTRRPQVQERLTLELADLLDGTLEPRGLIVELEARHLCMEMRGVERHGTSTVTTEVRGALRDSELSQRFRQVIAADASREPGQGAVRQFELRPVAPTWGGSR